MPLWVVWLSLGIFLALVLGSGAFAARAGLRLFRAAQRVSAALAPEVERLALGAELAAGRAEVLQERQLLVTRELEQLGRSMTVLGILARTLEQAQQRMKIGPWLPGQQIAPVLQILAGRAR